MTDVGVVNTLGLTLLHFLWQGLLIGLVYALGKRLLRHASADSRHTWALTALFLLALAPLVSFVLLQASPPVPTQVQSGQSTYTTLAADGLHAVSRQTGPALTGLLPWIVAFWSVGVLLMSLRLGLGWRHIQRLRNTAVFTLPAGHQALLERLCHQLGITQTVRLARSALVHGPILTGVLRPVILLPGTLATGLSPQQLEMVLAHELAHLRRFDHLINLFQIMVETLLFYHPVVRWISRDLRIERELASDEMAARLTGDRLAYAETLLMLEKERGDRLELAMAMADQQVTTRIRRLLAPAGRQNGSIGAGMAALVLVVASLVFGLNETEGNPDLDEPAAATTSPEPETAVVAEYEAPRIEEQQAEPMEPERDGETAPVTPEPEPATTASDTEPREDPTPGLSSDRPEEDTTVAIKTAAETGDEVDAVEAVEAVDTNEQDGAVTDNEDGQTTAIDDNPPAEESAGLDEDITLAQLNASQPDYRAEQAEPAPPSPVTGGELVQQIPPAYPRAAMRQGHEGSVEVRFSVDEQGRVRDAEVISESPRGYDFGKEAIRAVEQWRFEPFRRDGQTIRHEIRTGFDFEEPEECTRLTGSRIDRC